MTVDLSINPQKTTEQLEKFIRETAKGAGFQNLIIGISGGIDSAVAFALGVKALGAEHVFPALLPYGNINTIGTDNAKQLIEHFHVPQKNVTELDIQPAVDILVKRDQTINDLRKGNIMVRLRMILLFDLSKKYNALVLGTENRTEHILGYFTRFGDEASDIEPIRNLYKKQVRQLAAYLQIPEAIICKVPTAGMWEGQTDEKEFGFTYDEADVILSLYVDQKKSRDEIIAKGLNPETVDGVLNRMKANEFKHILPYTL